MVEQEQGATSSKMVDSATASSSKTDEVVEGDTT